MNFRTLTHKDITRLQHNWNVDMHPDFYLYDDIIQSQLFDSLDLNLDCSFVCEIDDIVVGGIVIKTWNRSGIDTYTNTAWISFLHVQQPHRNQSIGRQLVLNAIIELKQRGFQRLFVGKDMNNLFCGIAEVFPHTTLFPQLGFEPLELNYDLHRNVIGAVPLSLRNRTTFEIRLGTKQDEPLALDFFHRVFPGRWEEEYKEYLRRGNNGQEFAFLHKDNKIIAFCRVNYGTNSDPMYNTLFRHSFATLYGVGPLGVDPAYRGLSLGYDVTVYAINKAIERGASDIIIDWTSLVDLYRKFGFEIWHEYQSFLYRIE